MKINSILHSLIVYCRKKTQGCALILRFYFTNRPCALKMRVEELSVFERSMSPLDYLTVLVESVDSVSAEMASDLVLLLLLPIRPIVLVVHLQMKL